VSPADLVPGGAAPAPPLRLGDQREVLAARVIEFCADRGLSKRELARRSGLGRTSLRDVTLALRPARYATVAALAATLGVTPGDLVPGLSPPRRDGGDVDEVVDVTTPPLPPGSLPAPFVPPVSRAIRYRRRSP
jgi:hypothetical protein